MTRMNMLPSQAAETEAHLQILGSDQSIPVKYRQSVQSFATHNIINPKPSIHPKKPQIKDTHAIASPKSSSSSEQTDGLIS